MAKETPPDEDKAWMKRPSDAIVDLLAARPRGWSLDEICAHLEYGRVALSDALRHLVQVGAAVFTEYPSAAQPDFGYYRTGAFKPAQYGQGARRKSKFTADKQAEALALLPATTHELGKKTGWSAAYIKGILSYMKAPCGLDLRWYVPGTQIATKRASEYRGDSEYNSYGASATSWVATVPGTAGFRCDKRDTQVTYVDCLDSYVNAECGIQPYTPVCKGCALGKRHRAQYARS